jgi:hypothetical protein
VESTMTDDIRDWALRLLVRRQRLRLQLLDLDHATRQQGSAQNVRAEVASQPRSLTALAAMAEQLCAHTTAVRPL